MHKKTVLLVDDTELSLDLQKSCLRTEHLTLLTASNGSDALSLVRAAPPDLVFIGARLPGIDGVECCRRIKGDPLTARVPVVILSEAAQPEEVERYRRAGCDEVILKPISRPLFFETARSFLGVHLWTEDRIRVRLALSFVVGTATHSGATYDISPGGFFIETNETCPVGTAVELTVLLEGEEPIRCQGMVAWANVPSNPRKVSYPAGLGVEFVSLAASDRARLDSYLKTLGRRGW